MEGGAFGVLVLDILVGVILLGLFYLMLPKYRKIGGVIDNKIEKIKEQNTEIIPEENLEEEFTKEDADQSKENE